MKAVILAGGSGTRLSEETVIRPKPMVEIGGNPILWHIMKIYSAFGITDFIICLGYKGYMIKEYFAHYYLHRSDLTIDMAQNSMEIHSNFSEPWKVTLVDTGPASMTGGRLKRVQPYVGNDSFCFTYGDGLANVDLHALLAFHRQEGKLATLTAVSPPGRFGALEMAGSRVTRFKEKPQGEESWINGGFFVLEPGVFDLIEGDGTIWETDPLERLASCGELSGYRHAGFWQPMDTLRDKQVLEDLWSSGKAPWKVW